MLTAEEKAYCLALEALRNRDYASADRQFDACREAFAGSSGFMIIAEAARLMVQIQRKKTDASKIETQIKETVDHGEETVICRQGSEEETH